MVVTVDLNEWVRDKEGFWSRLRLGLAEFKQGKLPAEALGPLVNSDFGQSVALLIAVTSPKRSYPELRRYVESIENAMRTVDGIGRIVRYGERDDAIYVEADSEAPSRYGVSLSQRLRRCSCRTPPPTREPSRRGPLRSRSTPMGAIPPSRR